MSFASAKWLTQEASINPNKLVDVDWCGFGFTKVHRSIFEKMKYPYFPLNHAHITDCDKGDGSKFESRTLQIFLRLTIRFKLFYFLFREV